MTKQGANLVSYQLQPPGTQSQQSLRNAKLIYQPICNLRIVIVSPIYHPCQLALKGFMYDQSEGPASAKSKAEVLCQTCLIILGLLDRHY